MKAELKAYGRGRIANNLPFVVKIVRLGRNIRELQLLRQYGPLTT
jgi:hypothetical protein